MDHPTLVLELQATPEEVMRGVGELQEFCRAQRVEEKAIYALMLALEEIASNVVNHSYRRDPLQTFHLSVQNSGDRIHVEVRDHGPAFDPLQSTRPAFEGEDEDRPEGGWGIELVRHSIDDIQYAREGAENVLKMIKRIKPETA